MRPVRENRMPDIRKQATLLALSSIEEALVSFVDLELVSSAYHQSEWLIHFIEKRFGRAAIGKLLVAFRAGKTTETAVRDSIGLSTASLDTQFRHWALEEAPHEIQDPQVVKYE